MRMQSLLYGKWTQSLVHAVLAGVIGMMVLGSFLRVGWNTYDRAMLHDMVYSQAHRPFVYRVLSPVVIRRVIALIPSRAQEAMRDWAVEERSRRLLANWDIEPELIVEAAATCIVLLLSLLLFCYSMIFLLHSVFIVNPGFVRIASLVSLLGLPPFFRYYSYLYDFPTIALFTLALALMARRWWPAYFVVFLLACMSKETAVLLPFIFCLHFRDRMPALQFRTMAVAQGAIFVAVKLGLELYFAEHPGGIVESHIVHNFLLRPYTFGQFAAFVLIAVGIAHQWHTKPLFLRRALWILPVLIVLTFFLGLIDEYRDFYEAYPIVFALMCPSVASLVGVRMTPVDQ